MYSGKIAVPPGGGGIVYNNNKKKFFCVSVFYDSIRYVAIDYVSYREKRILWET
jgi:hypothetical protein